MSAADLAAVVVTIVAVAAVTALVMVLFSLQRTLVELRDAARALVDEAVPTVIYLRDTLDRADGDLDRLDSVLGTAETLSGTVESASRIANATVNTPAIKTRAALSGIRGVARGLKSGARS